MIRLKAMVWLGLLPHSRQRPAPTTRRCRPASTRSRRSSSSTSRIELRAPSCRTVPAPSASTQAPPGVVEVMQRDRTWFRAALAAGQCGRKAAIRRRRTRHHPKSMPNRPSTSRHRPTTCPPAMLTAVPVHRFYQNRMQINGGRNDMFAAWTNVGSLAMGLLPHGRLFGSASWSNEYTIADYFVDGAFGGSNLNHFWLICACSPHWEDAPERDRSVPSRPATSSSRRTCAEIVPRSVGPAWSTTAPTRPMDMWRTPVQPPYQPSALPPPIGGTSASPTPATTRCRRQTGETIGVAALSAKVDRRGLVRGGLGHGAGRSRRDLQHRRRGQLPAPSPALQLLRRLCAGDRGARSTTSTT